MEEVQVKTRATKIIEEMIEKKKKRKVLPAPNIGKIPKEKIKAEVKSLSDNVINIPQPVVVMERKFNPYKSFHETFKLFLMGKCIARKSWKDYYLCKLNGENQILIADPKRFSFRMFIPIAEDFTSEDWYVI